MPWKKPKDSRKDEHMEPNQLKKNEDSPVYPRVPIQPNSPEEIEKKSLAYEFDDNAISKFDDNAISKKAPEGDFATPVGDEKETQFMEPEKPRGLVLNEDNAEVVAAHERLVKKSAEDGIVFDPERGFIVEEENYNIPRVKAEFPNGAPAPKEEDTKEEAREDPEEEVREEPEEERDKWDEI
jgi:hypothetical protein